MERQTVEAWFDRHPETVHSDPHALLDRCESELRSHVAEETWGRARQIAERHLEHWASSFGLPASDGFVAREVCHELARELRHHEPVPGARTRRPSESTLLALSSPAREMLCEWLDELARKEEHRVWLEVVHFTDGLASRLAREEVGTPLSWDFRHSYPRTAERVTRRLIQEYEQRAHQTPLDDIE